ncbi:GNAT family N-acetyltransferase [Hymenobacter sp. 15J16-1T3B]|uniref:GNAT family N-acetyltransferase n=1 Tax=Hymenobacter sp. 15J16-1T3B TaxID=2886941 RepID=UPI001D0FBF15|nr:GNAT family N-acetyltransferase [Hymenobacter sp. 15J16-1T3B]MCC3158310.1 GNAT family N-acetyltransferase [Hymenobacter sp. 15J16-1T3B]
MEAKLLTDKSRLQDIYRLRVKAYEASPYAEYVNGEKYPNGYFDELDPLATTYHWIVEDGTEIIGSVRAAVIEDRSLLPEDISQLDVPPTGTFAYCGRTAVHPDYRTGRVMLQLDHAVKDFILQTPSVAFALCFIIPERTNAVKRLGFHPVGSVEYDWGNGAADQLEAFALIK